MPEPAFRSGFAAVVGRPNVGKSTLLNALIGQKVAIVSQKPQTTRNIIQCIYTQDDAQIVFLDTPGIHKPKHRLGEYMVQTAKRALDEVDVILFLTDVSMWTADDALILGLLKTAEAPVIAVLNKSDLVTDSHCQREIGRMRSQYGFTEVIAVSAVEGTNLSELIGLILTFLPEGPQYYPTDWITDHPERFVVAELIREQVLAYTDQEVPHSVAVDVDAMEDDEKQPLVRIRATIYVERTSQKGIVIGKHGNMLKNIGSGARREIETLLGVRVFLDLWVKVKKDWRHKSGSLKEFGYRS